MFECQDEIDATWVANNPSAAAALEDMLEAFESNKGRFPGTSEMAGIVKLCRERHDPAKIFWLKFWAYAFIFMVGVHLVQCGSDMLETLQ